MLSTKARQSRCFGCGYLCCKDSMDIISLPGAGLRLRRMCWLCCKVHGVQGINQKKHGELIACMVDLVACFRMAWIFYITRGAHD